MIKSKIFVLLDWVDIILPKKETAHSKDMLMRNYV